MSWEAHLQCQRGSLSLDCALAGDTGTVALIGPNGAGKTTLFRLLAGGLRPARGRFVCEGQVLYDHAAGIDLGSEERGVGYVPQGHGLFPHLGVLDNVAFGLRCQGLGRAERHARARQVLAQLDGAALADRRTQTLSGGESQRVAIARALAVTPRFLLLDEPLAALDAGARRFLRARLAALLATRARPTLVITHDLRDVLALDARVVVLEGGRVVQQGSLDALGAAPATDFVAEFCEPLGR